MLKKEITYVDPFDDKKRTEVHWFNLTRAEMIEYDSSYPGVGAFARLTQMTNEPEKYMADIIQEFKKLIMMSYGERTLEGKFIKNQALRDEFAASEAYSELFLEVASSSENAAAFINGICPKMANDPQLVAPAIG